MSHSRLSPTLTSGLEALGISSDKHNYEGLRGFLPMRQLDLSKDVEVLAEIIVYLGRHNILHELHSFEKPHVTEVANKNPQIFKVAS